MTPQDITTYIATGVPIALAALSTVHTFLDKHPRAQAVLKTLAHLAGPLNLPAVRDDLVMVCRAVVDAADAKITWPPVAAATAHQVPDLPTPAQAQIPLPGVKSW